MTLLTYLKLDTSNLEGGAARAKSELANVGQQLLGRLVVAERLCARGDVDDPAALGGHGGVDGPGALFAGA